MINIKNTNNENMLSALLAKLQNEDKRYSNLTKRFQYVYWVMVLLYLILIISDIIYAVPLLEIVGSVLFLVGMGIFAILFRIFSTEYANVDYADATSVMLKKAIKRYTPFHGKIGLLITGILSIDAGLLVRDFNGSEVLEKQIIFFSMLIVAIFVGLIRWRIKYKPLRDEAREILQQLEEV